DRRDAWRGAWPGDAFTGKDRQTPACADQRSQHGHAWKLRGVPPARNFRPAGPRRLGQLAVVPLAARRPEGVLQPSGRPALLGLGFGTFQGPLGAFALAARHVFLQRRTAGTGLSKGGQGAFAPPVPLGEGTGSL